ncbi:MAG: prenyltransferase/squalene oxidase repeat-containing protein [Planctomycetota bacterium]|nr:prenyltransferase/squalene oxidase repeat-containing protein [Planctomycetota bacterium]
MRRIGTLLLCCCVMAITVIPPESTSADQEAPVPAQYDKPIEQAVAKALDYLAKHQHAEGYWPSGIGKNTAVTSLSVMAFLGAGYTPGCGPYGAVINKGIDFVMASQRANGMLTGNSSHGPWYSHTISTLMLSEVSGMLDADRQKKLDDVLPKALRLILSAQKVKKHPSHQGGWRYQPTSKDSDISCTGWAMMSLRSARGNGAAVPAKVIDEAVKFVLRCRYKSETARPAGGAGFGYQPGGSPGAARTATAVLCLELCGKHHSDESLAGGDWILAHPVRNYGSSFFYYGLYYSAQAMFQLGGKHWRQYAPQMYAMMLKFQAKDGSWPQGSSNEAAAGTCYSTAMGVLALSVSYRQLPIYQR